VFGRPYVGSQPVLGELDVDRILADPMSFARSLDGEFVVVAESTEQLVLISDRFVSQPLFYSFHGEQFTYSFTYSKMWGWLRSTGALRPDKYAFYEFLKFQRLFGERTLDHSSKLLAPATIFALDKRSRSISQETYWSPNFEKRDDSLIDIAAELADGVRRSVRAKTASFDSIGLLLSGGMDSRVVLGGFESGNQPATYTVGSHKNNEVEVAAELAEAADASHYFARRSPSHYADILSQSSSAGGAMYSYQHGHFFGMELPKKPELILHGHGFDYMFQGMYLPSRRRSFLGRQTRNYSLVTPTSVVDDYIESAKYKLKGIDLGGLLPVGEIARAEASVRESIETVAGGVRDAAVEPFDVWDHLTFGWPGRHYTYLNLISVTSVAPQQTVAWDNTIFDLFHATPASVRFGTRLLAETIRSLRPELLEVRNANTNLSPKLSGGALTLAGWRRGLGRRMGLVSASERDPNPDDRSWPSIGNQLRGQAALSDRIELLGESEEIGELDLFEMSAVCELVRSFQSGRSEAASALATLLTIDQFLQPS